MSKRKILTSKQEILDYLEIAEYKFDQMIRNKLIAAIVIDGRWYAHTDNLDEYFRERTRCVPDRVPDEAE